MKELDLKHLNFFIANKGIAASTYKIIETGFDISPKEFIKFTEFDLTANYAYHLVNCLSNTKKTICSQLDSLLIGIRLIRKIEKRKVELAKKNRLLNKIR